MKRIRVLHLIGSTGLYGAEQVLLNLLPALKQAGIDVVFGCIISNNSAGADIGNELRNQKLPVFFIDEHRKVSLRGLHLIWQTIRNTETNIMHTHGYKATILGGMVACITGVPLVVTCHAEAKGRPDLSRYLKIENIFLRKAERLFAVSHAIKEELIARRVTQEKIFVISNGIEDPVTKDGNPPLKKLKSLNFPHLICVGRLIKSKRFDLAIEAVASLKDECPSILLTIAGEGPFENNMKKKVEDLRLIDHVRFLGHVKDMKGIYEMADIFILPSETEGSPISLIEAMAFSLPIIVTPVGAIPEMVEHGKSAMMIDPNDLTGLIKSIRYLMSNQEYCQALGKAARERFLAKFNSNVMASAYAEQYQAVLQKLEDDRGVYDG